MVRERGCSGGTASCYWRSSTGRPLRSRSPVPGHRGSRPTGSTPQALTSPAMRRARRIAPVQRQPGCAQCSNPTMLCGRTAHRCRSRILPGTPALCRRRQTKAARRQGNSLSWSGRIAILNPGRNLRGIDLSVRGIAALLASAKESRRPATNNGSVHDCGFRHPVGAGLASRCHPVPPGWADGPVHEEVLRCRAQVMQSCLGPRRCTGATG